MGLVVACRWMKILKSSHWGGGKLQRDDARFLLGGCCWVEISCKEFHLKKNLKNSIYNYH